MSFGRLMSGRSRFFTFARVAMGGAAALLAVAGCNRQQAQVAPPPNSAASLPANPAAGAAGSFQPYTVLTQPPPSPAVVTHVHRNLHLLRLHGRTALADAGGRVYDIGRDPTGRLYPTYRAPGSGRVYPLYYDSARDRYYRVVKDDQGRFLRGYADDPENQYYVADRDYERYAPSDDDRPVIVNNETNNYYYRPSYQANGSRHRSSPPAHHGGHRDDWLWAIPVVAAAYFLLRPHHANPPHIYRPRPAYVHAVPGVSVTRINSDNHIVNNSRIINNNHIVNNHVVNQIYYDHNPAQHYHGAIVPPVRQHHGESAPNAHRASRAILPIAAAGGLLAAHLHRPAHAQNHVQTPAPHRVRSPHMPFAKKPIASPRVWTHEKAFSHQAPNARPIAANPSHPPVIVHAETPHAAPKPRALKKSAAKPMIIHNAAKPMIIRNAVKPIVMRRAAKPRSIPANTPHATARKVRPVHAPRTQEHTAPRPAVRARVETRKSGADRHGAPEHKQAPRPSHR